MSDDMETKVGRITNSDIDKRVGRLETSVQDHANELHQIRNDLTVVKLQGEHNHALISAKFEQMITLQQTQADSLARLAEKFDNSVHASVAAFADPEASAAGRTLVTAIKEVSKESKKTRDTVLKATAILMFIIFIATIFGPPFVQEVLRLPN